MLSFNCYAFFQVCGFLVSSQAFLAPGKWGFWSLVWTAQEKPPSCTDYRLEKWSLQYPVSATSFYCLIYCFCPFLSSTLFMTVDAFFSSLLCCVVEIFTLWQWHVNLHAVPNKDEFQSRRHSSMTLDRDACKTSFTRSI